jgi:hypothetical protein
VVHTLEHAPPRAPEPEKPAPAAIAPEATKRSEREQLLQALAERFEVASVGTLLKPADEYRFSGGPQRIAFTDHGKRLSTQHDDPEVVRGMVDLAQAKGWREIAVAGTPEFQRATWLQGTLRGIHVAGYSPSAQDQERLKTARAQHQPVPVVPQEKPDNSINAATAPQPVHGASSPSREQWMQMTRSVMKEQGYSTEEIDKTVKVMAQKVDGMLARGERLPPLQVYDKAAPSRAPVPTAVQQPTPQHGHSREVEAPGR